MTNFDILIVVAFLGGALVISLCLTSLLITLGPKLGLMDEPDDRRVHETPIPRAGGIAIWLSFLAIAWAQKFFHPFPSEGIPSSGLLAFTASSFVLMVVGFIDDRRGMNALVKLGGQIAACLLYTSDAADE